jgi:hypothetical protein
MSHAAGLAVCSADADHLLLDHATASVPSGVLKKLQADKEVVTLQPKGRRTLLLSRLSHDVFAQGQAYKLNLRQAPHNHICQVLLQCRL